MRREYHLPEEDAEYLDSLGRQWETIVFDNVRWLLVHMHPVPDGYAVETVTAAIKIEGTYPPGKLDMVYFHPHLARKDGKAIPNTESVVDIAGLSYQRWSRHRTEANPWRPGVDNIATQLSLVEHWLEREFDRR
jgi:hypothetical protein